MDKDLQQAAQKALQAGINPQLISQRIQQIQQNRNSKSVLSGNLNSSNLVQNNGIVGSLVNTIARPFVQTGQTIAGSAFEVARALKAAQGQNDAYAMENGKAKYQNPFLSQKAVENPMQVLGNQVKNSAAIASYGIPIGGSTSLLGKTIAPGAFKGGALAGGLQAFGTPDATAEDVLKGAAVGGVLGKGIEVTGNVLNKFKGSGQALESAGTNLRTGKINLKASVTGAADEKAVASTLQKYGIKGTPQVRYEKVQPVVESISQEIDAVLGRNARKINPKELETIFMKKATPYIRQGSMTAQEAKQGFFEWVNNVKTVSPEAFSTTKELFPLKKDLQAGMENLYKKVNNGSSLTPTEKSMKAIRDTLDEVITKANPEVKQLTMDQSRLYDAIPFLSSARKTIPTVRALGITIPKGPTNKVVDVAGAVLETAGKGAQSASKLWPGIKMPVVARQALPRLASLLQSLEGGQPLPYPTDSSLQNTGLASNTLVGESGGVQKITPEIVQAAYFVLPKGKADIIKQLYDMQLAATGTAKPLSVTAQKQKELGYSGLQAHADALEMFKSDPSIVTKRTLTGGLATRKFDAAINRAVEALLRARSGAAVPQSEVNKYMKIYSPTLGDSYQTGLYKLQTLQNDLQGIYNGSENTIPDYVTAPSPQ